MQASRRVVSSVLIAEDNFVETNSALGAGLPGGVVTRRGRVTHVFTGMPIPSCNLTIVHRLDDDVDSLVDTAFAFHESHGSPTWQLAVRPEDAARFEPSAAARGLALTGRVPMMVLDPIPPIGEFDGLRIRVADGLDDVLAHLGVLCSSFGMSLDMVTPMATEEMLGIESISLFIGEIDGVPVASSMLSVTRTGGVACAGVYGVGTVSEYRRSGLGTAMTAWAADVGRRDHGCSVATLQPSPMGYSVYASMGYIEVTRWETWSPPTPD